MYLVISEWEQVTHIDLKNLTTSAEKEIHIDKCVCKAAKYYFDSTSNDHISVTLIDETAKTAVFYTFERVPETIKCVEKSISESVKSGKANQHAMKMQDLPGLQFPMPASWSHSSQFP